MYKYKFILLIIFCQTTLIFAQDSEVLVKEFVFNKTLTLGDKPQNDIIFGLPYAVLSDSERNIIVSDNKQGVIRVFDSSGKFISNIGRTGRGPGEFLQISSLTLLPNDELLVFDFFQKRFTKFSMKGEVLDTYLLPKNEYMKPDIMKHIKNVGILTFYRSLEGSRAQVSPDKDFLIHILSEDLETIKHEFVPISETVDISSNFEKYFEGGMFHGLFTVTDTTVTLAPFFYRGKILQYHKKNNWQLTNTFNGYVETNRTYEPYDNPREIMGKGKVSNTKLYGPLGGFMKNESLGIFQKQNGDYLYLGLLEIDGKQRLYVNLFDEDGELKAHGRVTNLHPGIQENDFYRRMRFYWMDDQDQLYVIDGAEDGFYVYRGTIDMKK